MSAVNPDQYAANVSRIAVLMSWKQPLPETDKIFWRDHLLSRWQMAQDTLAAAKAAEMDLRKQIVAFSFDPTKQSGTERIELGNGYELKAVKKLNYGFVKRGDGSNKLDKGAVDLALTKIEQSGPAGAYIADNLVKWEPTLSLTEYKKLDEPLKKIIDAVIVTSDGAPSLEIVPPKGSK